jgi:hypothetical protein
MRTTVLQVTWHVSEVVTKIVRVPTSRIRCITPVPKRAVAIDTGADSKQNELYGWKANSRATNYNDQKAN